jgi:hypothetical protein
MQVRRRAVTMAALILACGLVGVAAVGAWPSLASALQPQAAGGPAGPSGATAAAIPPLGVMGSPLDDPAPSALPESLSAQGGLRLDVVAHEDLGGDGLHADVWLHRRIAYVGTWAAGSDRRRGCPGSGVKIVDLADPAQPVVLGSVAEHPGTSAEVVRVRAVDTPSFRGDLLAVGLQACGGEALRGVDLWDVSDPRAPQRLGFADTGSGTGGVHELDLIQRVDGRVLALLTVPFSETQDPDKRGDFRIVEVTDPRAPQPLAAWGVRAVLGADERDGQGLDAVTYAHGARASADGLRAYVAYWDAGVVILDLADPAAPRYLGRTSFPADAEGNAHSTDLAQGGRVLVEADEILDVERGAVRVESPTGMAGLVPAGGTLPAPPWPDTPSVTAELAYLGRGCPAGDWTERLGALGERVERADPYPADPSGRIALVERGSCPFEEKLERARRAGAVGAVVINTADAPLAPSGSRGPLGAFGIPHDSGERLKAELAAGRPVAVTLSSDLKQYQDFGGVRLWDVSDPSQPRALSTFSTSRARVDRASGPGEPGRYSAHNPVVNGNLLFVSWFSDGVRVLDIADASNPREVAAWVPPADAAPRAVRNYLGDGPQVWGVAVDGDLVVASDINSGLYVLRLVR